VSARSFVALRLLGGIAPALDRDRRYWVHATWIFLGVFSITLNWWLFWSYREVEWDYLRFLVALAPLGLLYVVTTLLVPAEMSQVRSWREHFFQVRVRFFAVNIAYLVAMTLTTVVLLGHPVLHSRRALPFAIVAIFAAGLASHNPRVQGAVVLVFAGVNVVAAAIFLRPGAFAIPG
jgi:hypothetical protein